MNINANASEIARTMTAAGPELYFGKEGAEGLRRKWLENAAFAADVQEIRSEGARLLGQPVPDLSYALFSLFRTQGTRLEYERVYFERRRRLNTFALLALMEPEAKEYEDALLEMIWAICGEQTWCLPAHVNGSSSMAGVIDLFSAETGFTLAELSVLFRDRLPAFIHALIADQAEARLFQPYLYGGPFSWQTAEHNWSAVCAGSVGAAAMLLLDDKEKLGAILAQAQEAMGYYLKGMGDDGACLEGLGYWNYGFGYFVYYADLLKRLSGGAYDWFRNPKVKAIASFQQKTFLGGSAVVNFSDTKPQSSVQMGLSCYVAALYPDEVAAPPASLRADFREDHCSRWAPAFRNLLWRSEAAPADWSPGSFYLPDAEWMISRVERQGAVYGFAAKGGSNGEPHNHNDLGQFLLAKDGVFYLADLGCGEYTREYFGEGRYGYDCNGSQGHSVPLIGGMTQSEGAAAAAKVLEVCSGEEEQRFRTELSGAYPGSGLDAFERGWVWATGGAVPQLELKDKFVFKSAAAPESLTERFVSMMEPKLAGNGTVRIAGDETGEGVEITYDPARVRPEISARSYRDHSGVDTPWFALDFVVAEPAERVELDFRFSFLK